MAALEGHKTPIEIAAEYEVHPTQISTWKKQALEATPEAFSRGQDREAAQREVEKILTHLDKKNAATEGARLPPYRAPPLAGWFVSTESSKCPAKRIGRDINRRGRVLHGLHLQRRPKIVLQYECFPTREADSNCNRSKEPARLSF